MPSSSAVLSPVSADYTVVGAGPAGICAVAKLLSLDVAPDRIVWIDPCFKVGDFGTTLSIGSSIPSNTTVGNFQQVNRSIYEKIPAVKPTKEEQSQLSINQLESHAHCPLKVASEPMQQISNGLMRLVRTYCGTVLNVRETNKVASSRFEITIQQESNPCIRLLSERVLLATGAKPKQFSYLPSSRLSIIPLNTALVSSELKNYLKEAPKAATENTVKKVAVLGSSHSAALSAMNLLREGIAVKQLMNKLYRFAVPRTTPEGIAYTQFDNTGLKGEVASYMKDLLAQSHKDETQPSPPWEYSLYHSSSPLTENDRAYFDAQLQDCTHLVVAIGYEVLSTLTINDKPLRHFRHDSRNTNIGSIPGLFGLGIAFPQTIQSPSGEVESAVGYGKFWATVNNPVVIEAWTSPCLL